MTRHVILFQDWKAAKVKDGSSLQTIRPPRKRPIHPGDELSLRRWTGKPYRSKQEVLREAVCSEVMGIEISKLFVTYSVPGPGLDALAHADGFRDWPEMREWFRKTHGLPFVGVLIRWAG